ncbi:UDP-Glycosyltransferase/glycogen phosphorylase [Bimuria novae-zelandiae CBS 107.79]|uniref:UDP-Glycosyltransferase/glycogen phosphorylase n=1 Tax=Bimuria novae-zelandiae CBS 107.79 TaxID=1447943 RepID=A0A6A5UYT5_9PLEO|nr:UDP-Glycosyltransferase/glycogen phosphorylase [Bimuria novae-zelandiae CBS 107.79]
MAKTVFCGLIVEHIPAISPIEFPETSGFLDRKRTIVINFGTFFTYTDQDVEAVSSAISAARQKILETFQVLWKLPEAAKFTSIIGRYFDSKSDRADILVREWIDPPAPAVLQHPNVACFMSHASANSVIEAAYAGVPQIRLAFWLDLFTLAARSEWAGIGIYANKGKEPEIDTEMLTDAIVRVSNNRPGTEGALLKLKAEELGRKVRASDGVGTVSSTILKAAMGKDDEILFHTPCLTSE